MKSLRLLPVITAALLAAGCGSGESSITVVNTDSEGNIISSSVVDTDAMPQTVTEPPAETSAAAETSSVSETAVSSEEVPDSSPTEQVFSLSAALNALDSIGSDSTPTAFGSALSVPEALNEQVSVLTSAGHKVSFAMLDLNTLSGISCNSGSGMCTQSVIKAAYIGSLAESDPSLLTSEYENIHDAVAYSDNYSYMYLRDKYGTDSLRKWCAETGVSQSIADSEYPVMSASDMLRLWLRLYSFINSDDTGAKLGKLLEASVGSAGRQLLMGQYTVQSKSGWECGQGDEISYDPDASIAETLTDGDPFNDECAANDAGIVYTENGTYIYVILTDIPFGVFEENTPANPLTGLLSEINNARSR